MEKSQTWAVDLDITIASFLFGINIAIYKFNNNRNYIHYLNIFSYENNSSQNPLMLLINENLNHFDIVKPKIFDTNINIMKLKLILF